MRGKLYYHRRRPEEKQDDLLPLLRALDKGEEMCDLDGAKTSPANAGYSRASPGRKGGVMTPADHKPIEGTRSVEYRQGYADGCQAWTWREVAVLCICMGAVDIIVRRFLG